MSENSSSNNNNIDADADEAIESLTTTKDSCSSSNAKRPGRSVANTSKKMKSEEEPIETRFTDLPDIVLLQIASFFGLKEVLCNVRWISKTMQRICDGDERWLPVIAPPTLAHKVLKLEEDGAVLRRLYKEYSKWFKFWCEKKKKMKTLHLGYFIDLRSKISDLDGFFSLSPWEYPGTTYPTPWLHRMVYDSRCPDAALSLW
mmetsp:Transcript_32377/g.78978  ORF Transcript_32377/g.78978 Transcript_32377/m.78978 type:complete len:202 (+) Transcript_32377:480-1085(+)